MVLWFSGYGCNDHFLESKKNNTLNEICDQFLSEMWFFVQVFKPPTSLTRSFVHSCIYLFNLGDTYIHCWEILIKIMLSAITTDIICDVGMLVFSLSLFIPFHYYLFEHRSPFCSSIICRLRCWYFDIIIGRLFIKMYDIIAELYFITKKFYWSGQKCVLRMMEITGKWDGLHLGLKWKL